MKMDEFARRSEEIKGRLYKTAIVYLQDPDAAEEALAEAVYRGVKACGKLKDPGLFDTWMTRILINACCDELKRRKRQSSVDEIPEDAAEKYDSLPLRDAVCRLPRELKDVIVLRYFSGYGLKETAEILGTPQGTAATRQRRALALLRLELEEV